METKSLYVDSLNYDYQVQVDDFFVAIGKLKSNSVYHVAEIVRRHPVKSGRMTRTHMRVVKTDLITALRRDESQVLIPFQWYSRNKK